MALQLNRLIEKVAHLDITLLAGKSGLNNLVNWVHMVETPDASAFLEGGEIVITTGIGVKDQIELLELLKKINQRQAAGIIINIGPYMDQISQSTLDYCNEHSLPLFVVPWKIHLSEIMRIFCFSITKETQRHIETASAFKNAIFFPQQEELYLVPLSQRNFNSDWKYSVCLIHLDGAAEQIESRLDTLAMSLDNYAHRHYQHFAIFTQNEELLIVTGDYSQQELYDFVDDIAAHAKIFLLNGEEISLGVGRLTKSIRCLHKSYRQAKAIQKLQQANKIPSDMIHYSQMGLYRLIMGIDDKDIAQDYFSSTIGALLTYDETNDSDLAVVLKSYLDNNGSVKDTAAQLYVHRNTINYKLNKIEHLLGMDLSNLNSRLQLMIAFMVRDII